MKRAYAVSESEVRRRADPVDELFALDDSPFYWISRVSGRYMLDLAAALRKAGLDVPRWRVLMILHETNPASISTISERAVIKLSTVTRIVQRMQADGLVTCSPRATDARVTEVSMTPAGAETVEKSRSPVSRIAHRAFDSLSDEEITVFIRLLRRLFDNLETPPR